MWYLHVVEFYSAIKKNEVMNVKKIYKPDKTYILSVITWTYKQEPHVLSHMEILASNFYICI